MGDSNKKFQYILNDLLVKVQTKCVLKSQFYQ